MSASRGEQELQAIMGSEDRAQRFYDSQVNDRLNDRMKDLIRRQEMVFVATADAKGNCDCSPRFGKPGFVVVLDDQSVAYPEFRGNGVYASLGNILENPHIGLVFVDFFETTVGLHVNGIAASCSPDEIAVPFASQADWRAVNANPAIERWVVVKIEEAFIHCSKHVPLLQKIDKSISWGTDDPLAKSEGFFGPTRTRRQKKMICEKMAQ